MLSQEEAFVKKRFKVEGFTVVKLDKKNDYKAPDFKLSKNKPVALVEVKVGFKKGKILETLPTGAFRFDSAPAIEDYFREVTLKYLEYIKKNTEDKNLPYILVFIAPFFIDNELGWSDIPYKKYRHISAIFIPKRTHLLDKRMGSMTLEELEKIIFSHKVPFNSQTKIGWRVIKNPYALNPIKNNEFSSIISVDRPIKNKD